MKTQAVLDSAGTAALTVINKCWFLIGFGSLSSGYPENSGSWMEFPAMLGTYKP